MNEQLTQSIDDILEKLYRIISQFFGEIRLKKSGKVFLQPGPGNSGFRNSVHDRVLFYETCFDGGCIPDDFQPLIVAHAIRTTLEKSPIYLQAKATKDFALQQVLEHELTLLFTHDTHLKPLRLEQSHRDLGNQRPSYNPAFHGEFSYALLHILNHHHLHVDREYKPSLLDIATTMGQEFYLRDKEGTPLGWRAATPYGVDAQLPKRKKTFCDNIDKREPPIELFNEAFIPKEGPGAPVTLAIWNRNAPANRDPERRLGLNLIKHIVLHTQKHLGDHRPLRLLIVGDTEGLNGLEGWAKARSIVWHDHRGEHMLPAGSPEGTPILPKNEQLYHIRKIMEKFDPSLIVGARSGLMALCSLVGCAGLQIDLTPELDRTKASRTTRESHARITSAAGVAIQNGDQRLLEVFARCPEDGLGPHIKLAMSRFVPDVATPSAASQAVLELTLSAMMVEHPDFKPLMLETLASHLAGNTQALQRLRDLLNTYNRYINNLKEDTVAKEHNGRDNHGPHGGSSPDSDKKPGGDSSSDDRKKGGDDASSDGRSKNGPDASHDGDHQTPSSHQGHSHLSSAPITALTASSQHKEITMNSEIFFAHFKTNPLQHQAEFMAMSTQDKIDLCVDGVLNLNIEDFALLYNTIIPEDLHAQLLRHDEFILFEYALNYPQHLDFLLLQLGDGVTALLENGNILRCALQRDTSEKAIEVFEMLKKANQSTTQSNTQWSEILTKNDYLVILSIVQHIGADYAWNQCHMLTAHEKKQVLMADNYMMFRHASLSVNRTELLLFMGEYLSPVEFKCGVNAYSGDVVYKAILAEDQAFFNRYYPMLHEDEKADLHYRMATSKDARPDVFSRYQQAVPQSKPTPSSITGIISPPQGYAEKKGKISQEDRHDLAQKSRSMFSMFGPDEDEHEISERDDVYDSKVTNDY